MRVSRGWQVPQSAAREELAAPTAARWPHLCAEDRDVMVRRECGCCAFTADLPLDPSPALARCTPLLNSLPRQRCTFHSSADRQEFGGGPPSEPMSIITPRHPRTTGRVLRGVLGDKAATWPHPLPRHPGR